MPTDAPVSEDLSRLSRHAATRRTRLREAAGEAARSPKFGPRLLGRLARIAAAAKASRPSASEAQIEPRTARAARNLCEFDYDYYVALEEHRHRPPVRLREA